MSHVGAMIANIYSESYIVGKLFQLVNHSGARVVARHAPCGVRRCADRNCSERQRPPCWQCTAAHSCRAAPAPLPSFMPGSCSPFPAGSRSRTRPSSSPTARSGRSAPASPSPAAVGLPADTAVIDLRNKFVMPGFLDLHVHLSSSGMRRPRSALPRVRGLLLADRLAQRARDPDGRLHDGARPRLGGQRDLRLARCCRATASSRRRKSSSRAIPSVRPTATPTITTCAKRS